MNNSGGPSGQPKRKPWGVDESSPSTGGRAPKPPPPVRRPGVFSRERPGYRVRLIRNAWTGEIVGIRIWKPGTRADDTTQPTRANAAETRQAFARFLGTAAAAWPGPGTGRQPPASSDAVLALGETLLDPRMLVVNLVAAAVQVAALHAGILPLAAQAMGRLAGDEVGKLLGPDSAAGKVQALQVVDLTLSADNRAVIKKALATTDMTADEIGKLLRTGAPLPAARRPLPTTEPRREPAPAHTVGAPPPPDIAAAPRRPSPSVPAPADTGAPLPAPPGWYTVPGTTTARWWDGARWTDHGPSPSRGPGPKDEGQSPISL